MPTPNEQVTAWLATADRDEMARLIAALSCRSLEAAVLTYQWVANGGRFT